MVAGPGAGSSQLGTLRFLRDVSRYFAPVRWRLVVGSLAGIAMNTAAVLPPLLLGAAIGSAIAFSRGEATAARVGWSALLFLAGTSVTAAIQEMVSGVRLLRLFGRGGAFLERISSLSERYARANVATTRLRALLQPVYSLLMVSGVLIVVWKGGEDVIAGVMTVGGFVAYLEIFLRFVGRAPRIPQLVNSVQSGASAFERLRPLLEGGPSRPSTSGQVARGAA